MEHFEHKRIALDFAILCAENSNLKQEFSCIQKSNKLHTLVWSNTQRLFDIQGKGKIGSPHAKIILRDAERLQNQKEHFTLTQQTSFLYGSDKYGNVIVEIEKRTITMDQLESLV